MNPSTKKLFLGSVAAGLLAEPLLHGAGDPHCHESADGSVRFFPTIAATALTSSNAMPLPHLVMHKAENVESRVGQSGNLRAYEV